ncbi:MAG: hypothetical protein IJ165_01145 [Proteobacteria bacterium]|nr:hypothetical protein [Pseudomonadota bacterium]
MIVLMGGDKQPVAECEDGKTQCVGELEQTCENGHWGEAIECGNGGKCNGYKCEVFSSDACSEDEVPVCEGNSVKTCVDGEWVNEDCGEKVCVDGECRTAQDCEGNEIITCEGNSVKKCEGGKLILVETCINGTECREGKCECVTEGKICEENSIMECSEGKIASEQCTHGCDKTLDDPKCYDCQPGTVRCDENRFEVCTGYDWNIVVDCNSGTCLTDKVENGAYMACKCKNDEEVVCTGKDFNNVVCTDIQEYSDGDITISYFYGESKGCKEGICENNECMGAGTGNACLNGSEKCGEKCCGDGERCENGICKPNNECSTSVCEGGMIRECHDGELMEPKSCEDGLICKNGGCVCESLKYKCDGGVLMKCEGNGWKMVENCNDKLCNPNSGKCEGCKNDEYKCTGTNLMRCENNHWKVASPCSLDRPCNAERKSCDDCVTGEYQCPSDDSPDRKKCVKGKWVSDSDGKEFKCKEGEICSKLDGGACIKNKTRCEKDKSICKSRTEVMTCSQGRWNVTENCPSNDYVCGQKGKDAKCVNMIKPESGNGLWSCDDKFKEYKRCDQTNDNTDGNSVRVCNASKQWKMDKDCKTNKCGYKNKTIMCIEKIDDSKECTEYSYVCNDNKEKVQFCIDGKLEDFANCKEVGLTCKVDHEGQAHCGK